jgi:hypothetical protein
MNSRRIRGVALVLCTAAIAAPAAQATTRPPEGAPRVGGGGTGGAVSSWLRGQTAAIVAPAAQATKRPPEGAPRVGGGGTGGAVSSWLRGYVPVPQPNRPVVVDRRPIVLESGGFDWADAGIGVAGAAGLVLVGGGALLLARRGRRGHIATSE